MTATAEPIRRDPEELVQRYLARPNNELRDAIVQLYTPLVEISARRYASMESVEDLVQVGYLGLLNALRKFDPASGVKFGTYAGYLVSGEIKHYLRDRSQTIRQPAWLQELRHRVRRERTAMQAELGRPATEQELADRLGCPVEAISDLDASQDNLRVASLDEKLEYGDGTGDGEPVELGETPEGFRLEDRVVLEEAIGKLKDLERQAVVMFHFDSLNQTEIAKRLGISGNYVSYLLRQAIAKLRRILSEQERRSDTTRRERNSWDDRLEVYTESYFRARLQEELLRAGDSQNGLGVVLVEVSDCLALTQTRPDLSPEFVMTELARALRERVRRTDIVGRYTKHGFAVIFPSAGVHTEVIMQRLRRTLDAACDELFGQGQGRARFVTLEFPKDFHTYREFAGAESSLLAA